MPWLKLVLSLTVLLTATDVAAQCAGGVPDGGVDPDNPCRLCDKTSFVFLPERTACGAERRVQCDGNGAFRVECVADPVDPAITSCESNYRWTDCPNGLACDEGFCLPSCMSTADCRTGFECQGDVCVKLPGEDMGSLDMGAADMSSPTPDMSGPGDMSGPPDTGERDSGATIDLGGATKPRRDEGGCMVATGATPRTSWVFWALAVCWLWRRRA